MAIAAGLPVARVELMDSAQIRASNAYSKLSLPETAHLFFEFHGSSAGVEEQARRFGEIAAEHGGGAFSWATLAEDRSRLWQARHDAFWAAKALRPGCEAFSTDVCVPIASLARCIYETRADIEASGITATILGHVGDGNFHVLPVIDMKDAREVAGAKAFSDRLVGRALAMGGTSTGEHGIGEGKRAYLERELGSEAVAVMRGLKRALDPDGIMNPGKILPGN